ncbi:hypothetical protein H6S82_17550 [Planktothrix sp. FACHB-1355]|uniref:Uncharacterized protein n=1 Tax=Aerosakkonema funiforme FACHB-1375 TaxID=2949571 RepID=A0A926VNN9_9CYAN|nr:MULTISPECIES: hypothetical protein [Oscillatoriales]MBD2186192.1 hypothetical protein [Aerosakkonema funiforme FACHB-1375]MBD3560642.1 hypothetical protein [Planktothrix sp. FACHB-1355]
MQIFTVFINLIKTAFALGLSTIINRLVRFKQFIERLNEGYNDFFQSYLIWHWFFVGLGILLLLQASFTGNIRGMIANAVITMFACPVAPFNKIPGLVRYLTIGVLTIEQLLESIRLK